MKTNDAGIAIIKYYEGILDGKPDTPGLDPYLDPVGIPTIGWGSTWGLDGKRVTMEHKAISDDEAQGLLDREVRKVEHAVARLIDAPLTEDQFSALVSFTYNLGSGRLQSSTLRRKINRHDYEGAAAEFPKWRRAGGVILKGLVLRRASEQGLFLSV